MFRPFLTAALAAVALTGCGWYTNVPAQIYVAALSPGSISYDFKDVNGNRVATIVQPKARLVAQLGSIGATMQNLSIEYRNYQNNPVNDMPRVTTGFSARVETSNYPVNPAEAPVQHAQIGTIVNASTAEFELPVITRHVTTYGLIGGSTNAPLVTAICTITGVDDANFPVTLDPINVPIYILGSPNN